MRGLIAILLLLVCTETWAGPEIWWGGGDSGAYRYQSTIGGVSDISNTGTTSTEETLTTAYGDITIHAYAYSNSGSEIVYVTLNVDGTEVGSVVAADGETVDGIITYHISSGSHHITLSGGGVTAGGNFSADTFRIPIP